jgi:hypothetical protein
MRAGVGAGLGGSDGFVVAAKGTPFVPTGQSWWELGTSKDPRDKANRDYNKRKKDHGDLYPRETTYVQVALRRWDDKVEWAAEKRKDGLWQDVLAFDADIWRALSCVRSTRGERRNTSLLRSSMTWPT